MKLDDLGGAGHRGFGLLAVAALDIEHDVGAEALVHERRLRCRPPRADPHDAGSASIVDRYSLGGIFGGKPAFGHDRRDDVADVAHFIAGEGRTRRVVHRPAIAERHRMHDGQFAVAGALPIVGRQRQQHARHFCRGVVDRYVANARMRVRAAHERAPRGAGQRNVIDELALAAQEAHILAPAQRLADVSVTLDHGWLDVHAAASSVSRTRLRCLDLGPRLELAAEIMPAMLPMHRGHDLLVALARARRGRHAAPSDLRRVR